MKKKTWLLLSFIDYCTGFNASNLCYAVGNDDFVFVAHDGAQVFLKETRILRHQKKI